MERQLVKVTVSLAITRERKKLGMAIANKTITIANTTSISTKVNAADISFFISIRHILS